MSQVDEFLEHHGIPGMKWGVRKRSGDTVSVGRSSKKASSDFKKTEPFRKKHHSELTNKQLQDVNNRMNLEQNYNRLTGSKSHLEKVRQGHNHIREVLGVVGTVTTLAGLYQRFSGNHAVSLGRAVLSKRDLAERLSPYIKDV